MDTQKVVKKTRWYRKLHRWIASVLFVFFLLISVTGILLGWKKNTSGYLLAKTHKGKSINPQDWISIDSLQKKAISIYRDSISGNSTVAIDRIDIRPDKGMAKILFEDNYTALQIDLATGSLIYLEKRRADFIEHLHDGTYIDNLLQNKSGWFKLSYTSVIGCSLLLLTFSGFWLWYNPKRIRNSKK
jgi:hypothetical protein